MEDWQKEKKTLDSLRSDWEEESKNIVKKLKVGDHMIQLGRKGDANYYNKELNLLVLTATKNFKKYYLIKIENFALFSEIID